MWIYAHASTDICILDQRISPQTNLNMRRRFSSNLLFKMSRNKIMYNHHTYALPAQDEIKVAIIALILLLEFYGTF